ncbi:unnamed protein product [Arabis nemorensis]|uniref:Putative plant transposon protein domain-containing protein n=1 Tax=Arabis nemorensis TaxID=586526 RepID=A0A565CEA4_9BRAS|nr:unnamed protein product [Arabis nemorensis]
MSQVKTKGRRSSDSGLELSIEEIPPSDARNDESTDLIGQLAEDYRSRSPSPVSGEKSEEKEEVEVSDSAWGSEKEVDDGEASTQEQKAVKLEKNLEKKKGKQIKEQEDSESSDSEEAGAGSAARAESVAGGASFSSDKFCSAGAYESYFVFKNRGIIGENLVDLENQKEFEYPSVIAKAGFIPTVSIKSGYARKVINEFYANLEDTVLVDGGVLVLVRGQIIRFSPARINKFLKMSELSSKKKKAAAALDKVDPDSIAAFLKGDEAQKDVVPTISKRHKKVPTLSTVHLSPNFSALAILAGYNWYPTTHQTHIAQYRALLLYKLAQKVRVDFGAMVFQQIMAISQIEREDNKQPDARKLVFPHLIAGMIQDQCGAVSGEDEVVVLPSTKVAETVKEEVSTKKRAQPVPSQPAPKKKVKREPEQSKPSSSASVAAPIDVSLGHISVPQGNSSQRVVNKALYQITSVLHQLAGIVQDVHQANQCTSP